MSLMVIFVALPLFAAFVLPIMGKVVRRGYDAVAFLTTAILVGCASYFAVRPPALPVVYAIGSWEAPFGIVWLLDPLSIFMLAVVNCITFFAVMYSVNYMRQYTGKYQYYSLLMLMLAGLNGVVLTADVFNLFVFLEITALSSYALVAFGTEAEELEASFKYMVLGSVASACILIGIAFLYARTGTLNMFDIARVLSADAGFSWVLALVSVLFIVGFGLKSALVPFHAWLPDAHPSAPAPISAMLSGVVIKTIGIYALARIFLNVFGLTAVTAEILLVLGGLSMFIGVVLAVGQWDFKRLLAYHSISQIGYVVCGIALGTPLGIAGGLFHLLNHSVFKSLLFFNAGSVEYATGTRELKKLGGLQAAMPWTSSTSLVASLSIAGVPPLCGFWSKLIIVIALFQAGRFGYGALAILVGVITLASFLKVQKYAFYRKAQEKITGLKEVPGFMCIAMIGLAILCIVIGIFAKPLLDNFIMPAADILHKGREYFVGFLGV